MNDNKIEPSIYRYILKHTRKDQIFLLLLTLASMPVVYASLEIPKIIVNSAISGQGVPDDIFGFETDQIDYLLILCFLFLGLVLLSGILKYATNVYRGVVGERMLRRVRFDLFSRILRFPSKRFKQVSQGEILPMVTAETEPLGGFIGDAFALPAFQGGLLLTYLFFIFNQDVVLGLAAIMLYPPQLYIIPKLQKRVNELAKQRVQAVRGLSDKVGESISGISDIHLNDTSHFEKARVASKLGQIFSIRFQIYKKKFFIKFLNNFLGQLTPFFFYSVGGYFVIKGELTLGALVAVLAAYKDLASPWRELLKFYQITEDIRVKYRQIIEQFDLKDMLSPRLQEDQDQDQETTISGEEITLSGVTYSEDDYVNSVDGVTVSILQNKHTGVIGQGGSGRQDLMQLIVRLLHPDNGQIRIGNENISSLSESILGREMAYVDSQSYVFTGSVKDNLVYGLKHRPDSKSTEITAERKKYITDAISSGNPIDDVEANWLDLSRYGSENEFEPYLERTLTSTELVDDIYELGLRSSIDTANNPELANGLMSARDKLSSVIKEDKYKNLVELLREDHYNVNLSLSENLFFGVPLADDPDYRTLRDNDTVVRILSETGLDRIFLHVGIQTAQTLSEIFSDVADGSPLFERFSFVTADQLPILGRLAKLPEDTQPDEIEKQDLELLTDITFKLTVAQHRLGLITEDIQAKVIEAHLKIKHELGSDNNLIEFFEEDRIARFLSVQDNILFGRIAYGQANAKDKVVALLDSVISESDLKGHIIKIGLDFNVGVGGAKLTNTQRQKLTLARALIKRPRILVVNDATAIFDKKSANRIKNQVLSLMDGRTVIWVFNDIDMTAGFDRILIMDKGTVVVEDETRLVMDKADIIDPLR